MKLAAVGCWDYKKENGGIQICEINEEDGSLKPLKKYCQNVNAGSTPCFNGKDIIYFIDETANMDYAPYGGGGGGYVYAARINMQNGDLEVISRKRTHGTNPSYCAISKDLKHLVVVHHTSSSHNVTRLVRNQDGSISSEITYDDASVVVFKLNEDGSIGDLIDFHIHPQVGKRHTLLHSIYEKNGFFISSDKGQDRLYSYKVKDGKIELVDSLEAGYETACRYLGFHPSLDVMYGTCEKKAYINVYSIDKNGKLANLGEEFLFEDSEYSRFNAKFATDCVVSPNGKNLYIALAAFAGEDRIVTMDLDANGIPKYRHYDVDQGKCPKAITMSDNGKYIYVGNAVSSQVTIYNVLEDGNIKFKENVEIACAASLRKLY